MWEWYTTPCQLGGYIINIQLKTCIAFCKFGWPLVILAWRVGWTNAPSAKNLIDCKLNTSWTHHNKGFFLDNGEQGSTNQRNFPCGRHGDKYCVSLSSCMPRGCFREVDLYLWKNLIWIRSGRWILLFQQRSIWRIRELVVVLASFLYLDSVVTL